MSAQKLSIAAAVENPIWLQQSTLRAIHEPCSPPSRARAPAGTVRRRSLPARRQTDESLRRYLLEEGYEVLEALDDGDPNELRAELGDLLFQIWFHAELAWEHPAKDGGFALADVVQGSTEPTSWSAAIRTCSATPS